MTDVQKSPMNLLKEALRFGGFREETFECENVNGERRLVPPFVTSMTAGTLSLTVEFGEEVKSRNQAKRITYDVLLKNIYPEEYELSYEDSAEYAEVAATEIPKAVLLKAKRESTVHHERVHQRMVKEIEAKIKDEEKRAKILERKKAGFSDRMEATNRNRFPTWEELDTIEDPEKVWFARMMKASRAFNLDIDWDFEFDFNDKENKKVTCTVQVHQKKEGEADPTFLFKLDHSAELGEGKEDDSDRIKGKGEFVRQIKGQLSEDIVNQLVTEGIAEDVDECATKILMERSEAFVEARLNETEEEREARIAKEKEERKNNPKKEKKGPKTMRQKLKERREKAAKGKDDKKAENTKKKALDEKIAAKKEKLKAKAKAKRDAKKGKKTEADAEEAKPKGKKGKAPAKKDDAPKPKGGTKTKAELRKFYLETVKKVSANDKLSEEKKKKLCDKYKKIYNEKVDALKTAAPSRGAPAKPAGGRNNDRNNKRNQRDSSPPRRDNRRDSRRDDDRRRPAERDSRRQPEKRERRDDKYDNRRGGKQMMMQQQPMQYMQPVMMPQQMYAPPPSQAYQPQQVQGRGASNVQSQIATLQAQQQAQMAQLQAQLQGQMQSYQQAPAQRHPQQAGGRPQQGGRRW